MCVCVKAPLIAIIRDESQLNERLKFPKSAFRSQFESLVKSEAA